MPKITIDKEKCKGCYLCIVNCPHNLIKAAVGLNAKGVKPAAFTGGKPARQKSGLRRSGGCTGCTMCAVICPECIIEVYK